MTFFALTGFENATTPVGKVRDPARTIPRAIIGGTLFVAMLYLLASTAVQLLLPADVVAVSPAPFADAIAAQWGGGVAAFAAFAIAVAAFGCLQRLDPRHRRARLCDGPEARPAGGMAWTWRRQHAGRRAARRLGLPILLILANSSRASASLFTFIILLSTAAVLVVYLAGALSAWRLSASLAARAAIVVALLFILLRLLRIGRRGQTCGAWPCSPAGLSSARRCAGSGPARSTSPRMKRSQPRRHYDPVMCWQRCCRSPASATACAAVSRRARST